MKKIYQEGSYNKYYPKVRSRPLSNILTLKFAFLVCSFQVFFIFPSLAFFEKEEEVVNKNIFLDSQLYSQIDSQKDSFDNNAKLRSRDELELVQIGSIFSRAEEGDAEAQFRLGLSYYNGEGVRQDRRGSEVD